MRSWKFISDMNSDNTVTIGDVWLWAEWLYFYPGDAVLFYIIRNFSGIATFFELNQQTYGNWFSFIVSLLVWIWFFYAIKILVFNKGMWIDPEYDGNKPFLKRAYGFWPMQFLYWGAFISIILIVKNT